MQFKLTAFYAFGFFEIFEVDDPLKVSCSTEVLLLIMLQTVLARKVKHSLLNLPAGRQVFGRSNKNKFLVLGCNLIAVRYTVTDKRKLL